MNCLIDMCNMNNPYGCCHPESCLFHTWFAPVIFVTSPIWIPAMICWCVYTQIYEAVEWSKKHRNYEE